MLLSGSIYNRLIKLIVNYANNVKEKSARVIGFNTILLVDNSTIADSFQAQLRIPDCNGKLHHLYKPVKHISMAFSPEDAARFRDNEEGDRFMAQLVEECLREMDIYPGNAQYVIARHFDKSIRIVTLFSTALPTMDPSSPTIKSGDATSLLVARLSNATSFQLNLNQWETVN